MEEETAGTGEFSTNISDSIGLVKAYLRVCEEEGADRNPWAIAYYCLRCGAYDDAISVFHQVISRSHNYDWSGANRANEPENVVHGLECWRNCFGDLSGSSNTKNMPTSMDWKAYVKTTFKNTSPNATLLRIPCGLERPSNGPSSAACSYPWIPLTSLCLAVENVHCHCPRRICPSSPSTRTEAGALPARCWSSY